MKYVQIHELVSYPASNLNRDELNRPKTVRIGDSTRLRISSQSLKRAWRTSIPMAEAFPTMGIRTNKLAETIEEALAIGCTLESVIRGDREKIREPVEKKTAKKYGEAIDSCIRSVKTQKDSSDDETDKKDKDKKKQLLHYSDSEIKKIEALMQEISEGKNPEIKDILDDSSFPVDIAMFGRMVANSPDYNCEAAVQVAHAFTVHKAVVEDDFFTAVDDLNPKEDTGAGHLGDLAFGAGLFYIYICVDYELLAKNLGSEEKARSALKKLLEVSATVSPTGKQNSFASRAYASYIMVEKGSRQPRTLSSAFLKPIYGDDLLGKSIQSFRTTQANMDKVFGKCYDECYEMDVSSGTGSMEEAGAFLDRM